MLQPIHAIGRKREMTPERFIGLGFVGILHIVAVSAIVFGLRQHYTAPTSEGPITVVPVKEIKTQVKPPMPNVELSNQRQVTVVPPHIDIARDAQPITDTTTQPLPPQPVHDQVASIPDTAATGITGTHSSPAYPLLDRRLGHEGTVTLRLDIAPDGTVTGARVIKSSGYAGLDEAAVSWVIAHWRYKPATHTGAAVPSETNAAVMFSLRTSG
jgi:periplasmic protein TonB